MFRVIPGLRAPELPTEFFSSQDMQAALARWTDASKWAAAYKTEVLPNLIQAKEGIETQFAGKEPAVDLARLLTVSAS